MTPSITIRIDYGSEGGSGAGGGVSVNGGLPTPDASGLAASTAAGQSGAGLPTPLDAAAQTVGFAEHAAPAPSPSLVPAGSGGPATGVPGLGDVPTPFSSGGFSPSTEPSGGGMPTPFDSVHGSSVVGDQAPMPHSGDVGHAERTAPAPAEPGEKEKSGRKGKK